MCRDREVRLPVQGAECQRSGFFLSREFYWSFHQLRCCTDVAPTLSAFPGKARPEAETFRGRKVELLREGYRSVPETAEVSSTGNVLPWPASEELEGPRRLSVTCVPLRAFPRCRFGNSPAPPPPLPSVSPLPCAELPGQAEPAVARDTPSALGSRLAPVHPYLPGKAEWECFLGAKILPLKQEGFWPPQSEGFFPPTIQPSEQAVSP